MQLQTWPFFGIIIPSCCIKLQDTRLRYDVKRDLKLNREYEMSKIVIKDLSEISMSWWRFGTRNIEIITCVVFLLTLVAYMIFSLKGRFNIVLQNDNSVNLNACYCIFVLATLKSLLRVCWGKIPTAIMRAT